MEVANTTVRGHLNIGWKRNGKLKQGDYTGLGQEGR